MDLKERIIDEINRIDPEMIQFIKKDNENTEFMFWVDVFMAKVADAMSQLWYNWSQKYKKEASEVELCAQCLFQMMIVKLKSIQKLSEGIVLNISGKHFRILDTTSMAIIQRSIYEMTTLFYYMFVKTSNKEEKEILYLLWKIKGLYNKLNPPDVPVEHKKDQDAIREEIKRYIDNIRDNLLHVNITKKAQDQLFRIINNERATACAFEFIKDKDGKIIDIKAVKYGDEKRDNEILGGKEFPMFYRYLSSFVHPSFLGVEQFGSMYNSKSISESEMYEYSKSSTLCCIFVSEFCEAIRGGKESFDMLSERQRNVLIFGKELQQYMKEL